jgi:sec-independent protein translocase protein TatB
MLRAMFGMGGTEILVILIVALLFLGPEKLPDAASKISKGIREMRKQTREVTQTIENDTKIGGAIRDLKSALRGDQIVAAARAATNPTPGDPKKKTGTKKKKKKKKAASLAAGSAGAAGVAGVEAAPTGAAADHVAAAAAAVVSAEAEAEAGAEAEAAAGGGGAEATGDGEAQVRILPPSAGEPADPDAPPDDDAGLADMIRPASGTVAHGSASKAADGHG